MPFISSRDCFAAVTDPGATNDASQQFVQGSLWYNITAGALRLWVCVDATIGAAKWALAGVNFGNGGCNPVIEITQFGGSALATPFGTFGEEGNLYRNVGNPIAANLADTTDDILDGCVLPAGAFDIAKRGIQMTFQGKFGATANNKKFRVWLNPTMAGQTITNGVITGGTVTGAGSGVLIYDSTAQTGNAVGWGLLLQIFKYGNPGSNTQYVQVQPIFGTTHGGITTPTFTTLQENAAINVVITGSSSTTGAANDVILNFSELNAMN